MPASDPASRHEPALRRNLPLLMLCQCMATAGTVLVVTIALVIWPEVDTNPATTPLGFETWQGIVFGQYVFKIGIAALDTPLFYVATHYLTNWIQEEEAALEANGVPQSRP